MRWAFWRRERRVLADVVVIEDEALRRELGTYLGTPGTALVGVVGPPNAGPMLRPIRIGPSIPRPRWWQMWRWHRIPAYRRQCREALAQFEAVFGRPKDFRERAESKRRIGKTNE